VYWEIGGRLGANLGGLRKRGGKKVTGDWWLVTGGEVERGENRKGKIENGSTERRQGKRNSRD
jgi:hypothetical protein